MIAGELVFACPKGVLQGESAASPIQVNREDRTKISTDHLYVEELAEKFSGSELQFTSSPRVSTVRICYLILIALDLPHCLVLCPESGRGL